MPETSPRVSTDARNIFVSATDEEKLYFQMIDEALAAADGSNTISNGKPAHAVYILDTFLRNAQEHVRICTGTLAQTFNGVLAYRNPTLIESAKQFLGRPETRLSIIVMETLDVPDGQPVEQHPLLAALDAGDGEGVRVSKLRGGDPDFNHHFVVMDEDALRVEVNPDEAEAFVIFGDEEFAGGLAGLFDSIEKDCEQLFPRLHAA